MKLSLLVLSFLFLSVEAYGLSGKDFEFHGYLRAGVGSNSKGGDQICFKNPNSPAGTSEFRLGNECSSYGELSFLGKHYKGKEKNDQGFFNTKFTLASTSNLGHDQYENANTQVVEAYLEGGRFNGGNLTYWVGKRFYRGGDIHLLDLYHTANTSGNGFGLGGIKLLD